MKNFKRKGVLSLRSKTTSELMVTEGNNHFQIKMTAGSRVNFFEEAGSRYMDLIHGDVYVQFQHNDILYVVDLGDWRFAKRTGSFGVSRQAEMVTVMNDESESFLRRDELIAPVETIQSGTTMSFKRGMGVISLLKNSKTQSPVVLALDAKESGPQKTTEDDKRDVASEDFCESPKGQFEQCAWKCFGAGKKDKKCASDENRNVQCVRFTCSAEKKWKLPTFAPSADCSVDNIRVGQCR